MDVGRFSENNQSSRRKIPEHDPHRTSEKSATKCSLQYQQEGCWGRMERAGVLCLLLSLVLLGVGIALTVLGSTVCLVGLLCYLVIGGILALAGITLLILQQVSRCKEEAAAAAAAKAAPLSDKELLEIYHAGLYLCPETGEYKNRIFGNHPYDRTPATDPYTHNTAPVPPQDPWRGYARLPLKPTHRF